MSLSKRNKSILTTTFIVSVFLLFMITKILYAPHKKTIDIEASYKGNAAEFITDLGSDTTIKIGVIIEILGEVTLLVDSAVTINNRIFCQFSNQKPSFKIGDTLVVKGRYIGYDDLMEEVKLDNCILKQ